MGGGVTFYAHSPFPSLYHDSMWVNCDVIPIRLSPPRIPLRGFRGPPRVTIRGIFLTTNMATPRAAGPRPR